MKNIKRLNNIDTNLWVYEYHVNKPMLHLRMRMVVVRLPSGGLWLYSSNPIDDALSNELDAIGIVEHIVAPNCFHHLFLKDIKQRYPKAKLWGAPGLLEKRKDIPFDEELSHEEFDWSESLESIQIQGIPKSNEIVFYHKSTKTLICADFIFNIQNEEHAPTKIIWKLFGVWKKVAQNRAWKYMTKDRLSAKVSYEKVLEWNIKRIIMAHGDIIDDGTAKLRESFSWLENKH